MLHRIHWDPAWRGSVFELGYLDRVAGAIVRVPLGEPRLESGAPSSLTLLDPDGGAVHIPLTGSAPSGAMPSSGSGRAPTG